MSVPFEVRESNSSVDFGAACSVDGMGTWMDLREAAFGYDHYITGPLPMSSAGNSTYPVVPRGLFVDDGEGELQVICTFVRQSRAGRQSAKHCAHLWA